MSELANLLKLVNRCANTSAGNVSYRAITRRLYDSGIITYDEYTILDNYFNINCGELRGISTLKYILNDKSVDVSGYDINGLMWLICDSIIVKLEFDSCSDGVDILHNILSRYHPNINTSIDTILGFIRSDVLFDKRNWGEYCKISSILTTHCAPILTGEPTFGKLINALNEYTHRSNMISRFGVKTIDDLMPINNLTLTKHRPVYVIKNRVNKISLYFNLILVQLKLKERKLSEILQVAALNHFSFGGSYKFMCMATQTSKFLSGYEKNKLTKFIANHCKEVGDQLKKSDVTICDNTPLCAIILATLSYEGFSYWEKKQKELMFFVWGAIYDKLKYDGK